MAATTATASLLVGAYRAAVAACDPRVAVAESISLTQGSITIGGVSFVGATAADIVVVAVGKAAAGMVSGVVDQLGPVRGIAASNHADACPVPLLVGAHPVPDETSVACGAALVAFVASLDPDDIVVFLVSGGGSSIAVAPREGVSLEDLAQTNRALMAAGMPIGDMNEVRAAISTIKGGGLAAACAARRSVTLVLSDVVGADAKHVASGPSLGVGMGAGAQRVVAAYGLTDMLPSPVLDAIDRFTPLSEPPLPYSVVGSTEVSAEAAHAFLEDRGVPAEVATTQLCGEARIEALDMVERAQPGIVTIATGETTVTVAGTGLGGRNQEGALAVAIAAAGTDTTFLACGTDGIDGPTPAAGAVVDGASAALAKDVGIDLEQALTRNDSYTALAGIGAVVVTGDTGTNVADIWMVARDLGLLAR